MRAKHTEGTLTVKRLPRREAIRIESDGQLVAAVPPSHITEDLRDVTTDEDAANAERIAACWNACVKVESPSALPLVVKAAQTLAYCLKVNHAETDEAIEDLRRALAKMEGR